jgi:hypothetical protein
MPTRPLNILSFGAKPDGKFDNAEIINFALEVAKDQEQALKFPGGVYAYGAKLRNDSVDMYGEDDAQLYSLDINDAAIYMTGTGTCVRWLRFNGLVPIERMSGYQYNRITVRDGVQNFIVAHNIIETSAAGGIMVTLDSHHGIIRNNYVHDTLADSIHMTGRCNHLRVFNNKVRNSGDDGVACVSYFDNGEMVHDIEAWGNDIRDNKWGRGMTVVGGERINYHHNFVDNNAMAAGIYLHQEGSWNTFPCVDVHVHRNTVRNCGSLDKGHYAISTSASPERPNQRIIVERNVVVIDNDARSGIDIRSNVLDSASIQNVVQVKEGKRERLATGVSFTPYTDGPVGFESYRNEEEDFSFDTGR